jgi:uncharacterized Fe-S cluster-containing radical SAM superfamily protein
MQMDYLKIRGKEIIKLIRDRMVVSPYYKNYRFYTDFSLINDGNGGVYVAGFPAGCNLDCYYCFSLTKDFIGPKPMEYIPPAAYKDLEKNAGFYNPQEAFAAMQNVKENRIVSGIGKYEAPDLSKNNEINTFILRGSEPTLEMSHLLGLLSEIKKNHSNFILETNGIFLGKNVHYIEDLAEYKENVMVYLTIKAGNPKSFEKNTNRSGDLLRFQFICLKKLVEYQIPTTIAYMCGEKFGNENEEAAILSQIENAGFVDKSLIHKQDYISFFVPEKKMNRSLTFNTIYHQIASK